MHPLVRRLLELAKRVLAELAARLCSESPALQAAAEECMAAHTHPLSHELVERVLLSPDLVPSILGPLEAKDGAAAAVCSQWLAGWQATNEPPWPRRRLKVVPLELPEEIDIHNGLHLSATPDGRLVLAAGFRVHILDRSMRVLQTLAGEYKGAIAASDDSIFHIPGRDHKTLCRSSHAGTVEAEYQLEGYSFDSPLLAPGGLLFCVIWTGSDGKEDEIIAVDAQTMQLRHRFGLGLFDGAQESCVAGDELYVCDKHNDRLQVFSLTGEHRRSITGEWKRPQYLYCVKDRLYLVEDDRVTPGPRPSRRILVLTFQGNVLQVVTHPTEPIFTLFDSICCLDRTLLVSYYRSYMVSIWCGVLALQGV